MDSTAAVATVDPKPSGVDVTVENKPYIRLGTLKDLEEMVDVACHAFSRDPVFNYMGNLKEVCKLRFLGSAKSESTSKSKPISSRWTLLNRSGRTARCGRASCTKDRSC